MKSLCQVTNNKIMHTVLRERYLRNDVPCGVEACPTCINNGEQDQLPSRGKDSGHPDYPNGHIVIPDTNVILGQVRFLKNATFIFISI